MARHAQTFGLRCKGRGMARHAQTFGLMCKGRASPGLCARRCWAEWEGRGSQPTSVALRVQGRGTTCPGALCVQGHYVSRAGAVEGPKDGGQLRQQRGRQEGAVLRAAAGRPRRCGTSATAAVS